MLSYHPKCFGCNLLEGFKSVIIYDDINKEFLILKLCLTCKNRYFSPEGFIQFGQTKQGLIALYRRTVSMGMDHCYSIPAKYKTYGYESSSGFGGAREWESHIAMPIDEWVEWKDEQNYSQGIATTVQPPTTSLDIGNGWMLTYQNGEWESQQFGKYNDVTAITIRKENKVVFGVNTSEYASVDGYEMEYFCDDENHLREFIIDAQPDAPSNFFGQVESNTTIHQWH